jgi:hypothetical protein
MKVEQRLGGTDQRSCNSNNYDSSIIPVHATYSHQNILLLLLVLSGTRGIPVLEAHHVSFSFHTSRCVGLSVNVVTKIVHHDSIHMYFIGSTIDFVAALLTPLQHIQQITPQP